MTKFEENQSPRLTFLESTAPGTPASTLGYLYEKTDGVLYFKNDAGFETSITSLVGAFAYHSTTQSFGASTLTYISLNSEAYDTSTFHDNATNNSRLTVPVTGYYRIWGMVWYATTSGTNYVLIDKNHAGVYLRAGATAQNGGGSGLVISMPPTALTAGDYIEMVGYHTEAGSIATGDTGTTPSQQNYLAIELVK